MNTNWKFSALALAALFSLTAVSAQKSEKKEKDKKKAQTITIVRSGDSDEKITVEVVGDKVTVNGKPVEEYKGDVEVITGAQDVFARPGRFKALTVPSAPMALSGLDGNHFFAMGGNKAVLGISMENAEGGAKVTEVTKESAAEKAGLKAGDIITKIDDNKIDANHSITEAIKGKKPGEKISITVLRDGKEQKLSAELGKWKGIHAGVFAPSRVFGTEGIPRVETNPFPEGYIFNTNRPKLGLSIQDTENGKGVKVIDIEDDGSAAKAGIKKDDVITHINDKEVNSADEVSRLVRANSNKPTMNFQVLRSGKTQKIEVTVPRKLKTADL